MAEQLYKKHNGHHVDATELARADAETQAKQRMKTTPPEVSDEVLASIDEALRGLDEMLAVRYQQRGGE